MLDVTYEAINDLSPGRLAKIEEDRGWIRVRLDENASLADVVRRLNIEIAQLMSSARWFQLWKDEIVSHNTPGHPLRIEYLLEKEDDYPVCVKENKGLVSVHIDPALSTVEFAAAMNPATNELLDGGQWFQMYAGEIIDNSPEELTEV